MKNRLKELRWEKNWTQTQLARLSGVSQPDIYKIENGIHANPGVYTVLRLAKALSVSVEDIFIL